MRSRCLFGVLALLAVAAPPRRARADFIDHFATVADTGQMKVPRRGRAPVLVIPVIIDDQPFEAPFTTEQQFLADLQQAFTPGVPSTRSFSGYYELTSFGRYQPEAVIAAPVHFPTCPTLGAYPGCMIPRDGGLSSGDLTGAVDLLRDTVRYLGEVLACADQGPGGSRTCTSGGGVNFADFDRLGPASAPDQWADGVILVSNGPFPAITLPVAWLASNAILRFTYPPLPDFIYDSVHVGAVAISGRRPGTHASMVAVHEFGHLLGFADLYDESGSTTDLPYSSMGGWYYTRPAPLLDPFSRGMIGWANILEVSGPQTVTLRPARDGGPVLKLGTGEEYFLAEYRTGGADLDADLTIPGGVVVERVRLSKLPSPDPGRFLRTLSSCVNCTAWDTLVMIEEADGRYDLMSGRPVDDANDLFLVGDAIAPSTDTAPRSASHPVFSTNRLSGAPTGTSLRVLEIHPDYAVVEVAAPALADPCADLEQQLCRELSCTNGLCGDAVPPPPPPVQDAGLTDSGAARPDAAAGADASSPVDARPGDAWSAPDAAADPDAGVSSSDAEGPAERDASEEMPTVGATPAEGCTCVQREGRGEIGLLPLLPIAAVLRRRRHRELRP